MMQFNGHSHYQLTEGSVSFRKNLEYTDIDDAFALQMDGTERVQNVTELIFPTDQESAEQMQMH